MILLVSGEAHSNVFFPKSQKIGENLTGDDVIVHSAFFDLL